MIDKKIKRGFPGVGNLYRCRLQILGNLSWKRKSEDHGHKCTKPFLREFWSWSSFSSSRADFQRTMTIRVARLLRGNLDHGHRLFLPHVSCPRCWCFVALVPSCEIMLFHAKSCPFRQKHALPGHDLAWISHRLLSNFPKKKGSNFCLLVLPPFHWFQCCCLGVPRWSFSNFVFCHHRVAMRWSTGKKYVATTVFASLKELGPLRLEG